MTKIILHSFLKLSVLVILLFVSINSLSAQIEVSATQFFSEFEENEIGADYKYDGKILIVTGEIYAIDKTDFLGSVTLRITLVGKTIFSSFVNYSDSPGIYCYFPNSEKEKIAQLKVGNRVSIKGKYNGTTFDIPELNNCVIYRTPQQIEAALQREREAQARKQEAEKIAEENRKEQERLAEERRIETERIAEENRKKEHTEAFLKERETKIYSFSESILPHIENAIKSVLDNCDMDFNLQNISIIDSISVNYNGQNTHVVIINGLDNPELKQKLINAISRLNFAPRTATVSYTQQQYPVNTEGVFSCNISVQTYNEISAKKRHQGITFDKNIPTDVQNVANTLMSYGGNYMLNLNQITINGKRTYNKSSVTKYNNTGTASNVFLSLLVPGLGDHRVSYGKKNGVGVALSTYALIGGGVGLKLYSNSEYKKYHAATEQDAMDKHYQTANYSNQAFYGCMIAGGIVWIYDVIWVWSTGAKNAKAAKAYKNSHLGAFYNPDLNATGLSYTINF